MPARDDAPASSGQDSDDEFARPDRKTARAARFGKPVAPGSKFKHLDDARQAERQAYEERGLITSGKTELENAVDLRGTCERMCSRHEYETRIIRHEHSPFELDTEGNFDYDKAVAAYTRSDAGAGMGSAAILPSDLRTPAALSRSLDYLFREIMVLQPSGLTGEPSQRKALGASAGFIRDRTRAIRKEFAMQSSWGHEENIESLERIARWHILCLRELQEQSGYNQDMHIDSAELGRCFTSLRQQYNDRREELGVDIPSPNEPEFVAYSLIYNLADRSVSIPAGELPSGILDDPLVQLAWDIRNAAQRNFDTQKDSSRGNAELGPNLITSFTRLLKQPRLPFLMSCLVEIRLRDMRRSALRSMTRAYPKLRDGIPVRYGDNGEIIERRMMLMPTLERILGCEEQENEEPAYDDVEAVAKDPADEAAKAVAYHNVELWPEEGPPQGALINQGTDFEDNRDGLFVRRWKIITDKRAGLSFPDIVDGKTGTRIVGAQPFQTVVALRPTRPTNLPSTPSFSFTASSAAVKPGPAVASSLALPPTKPSTPFSFDIKPVATPVPPFAVSHTSTPPPPAAASTGIPNFFSSETKPILAPIEPTRAPTISPASLTKSPAAKPAFSFDFGRPAPAATATTTPASPTVAASNIAAAAPVSVTPLFSKPGFFAPPAEVKLSGLVEPAAAQLTKASPPAAPPKPLPIAEPSQFRKSVKKASLSTSISRPSSHKVDIGSIHRHSLGPAITDRIVQEVIASMLEETTPEIQRVYKQKLAAHAYAQAKVNRQETIVQCSQDIFDIIQAEIIRSVTADVIAEEYRNRHLIKRVVSRWQGYAGRMKHERIQLEREREETFERLKGMGLGGNVNVIGTEDDGGTMDIDASQSEAIEEHLDEFEVDVAFRQAEQQKDHFYSPSTFLHQIARHVAALQTPATPTTTSNFTPDEHAKASSVFHTLLSVSTHSATPADGDAQDWLVSKFTPKDDTQYSLDGILFPVTVVDRYEEPPASACLGLCILDTPMKTWDSWKRAENTADAQDRMAALIKASEQMDNQLVPALLILTWEGETLDELVERLEIEEDVDAFEHVAVMSLEYSEDLDAPFDDTLKALLPGMRHKYQVTIQLKDQVSRLLPEWLRYIEVATLAISSSSSDAALAVSVFEQGVILINALAEIARSSLGRVKFGTGSTFNPIKLPAFQRSSTASLGESAEAIIEYLGQEIFADLDDAQLAVAPLRRGSASKQGLSVVPILQSLAYLVWGEMRTQVIPLESWWKDADGPREIVSSYLASCEKAFTSRAEDAVGTVTRELAMSVSLPLQEQEPNTSANTQASPSPLSGKVKTPPSGKPRSPPSGKSKPNSPTSSTLKTTVVASTPGPTPTGRVRQGTKRARQSLGTPSESKAAKNARLLRVMAEASRTLETLEPLFAGEGMDTGDGFALDTVN